MKIIPFSPDPLAAPEWVPVTPEKVISGTPQSAYKILYTSEDGRLCSGIYECTPGKWRVSYTEDEFCTLTEGRLRLTGEDGTVQEFSAPDSFMIPCGFKGFWEPLTKLRKFFLIYEKE